MAYGVNETNPLCGEHPCEKWDGKTRVDWTEPGLKITRLRLLGDPGYPFLDVSYCYGELDGKTVKVELPFSQLPKRRYKSAIVEFAKKDGVYAKGLGVFDALSTLV
jgi:hypothetical protein